MEKLRIAFTNNAHGLVVIPPEGQMLWKDYPVQGGLVRPLASHF